MSRSNSSTLSAHLVSSWSTVEKRVRYSPSPKVRLPLAAEILSQPKERVNSRIAARLISLLTAQCQSSDVLKVIEPYIEELLADFSLSPSAYWPIATLCSSIKRSDLESRFPAIINPLDELVERIQHLAISSAALRHDPSLATPLEIVSTGHYVTSSVEENVGQSPQLARISLTPHYVPDDSLPDPFDYMANLGFKPPSSHQSNPVAPSSNLDEAAIVATATKSLASVANLSSKSGSAGRVAALVQRNNPLASNRLNRNSSHSVSLIQTTRLGSDSFAAGYPDLNRLRPSTSKYGGATSGNKQAALTSGHMSSMGRHSHLHRRRTVPTVSREIVDLDVSEVPDSNEANSETDRQHPSSNIFGLPPEAHGTVADNVSPNQAASTDNEIIDLTAGGSELSNLAESLPSPASRSFNASNAAAAQLSARMRSAQQSSILGRLQNEFSSASGHQNGKNDDEFDDYFEDEISPTANVSSGGSGNVRVSAEVSLGHSNGLPRSNERGLDVKPHKAPGDLETIRKKIQQQRAETHRKSLALTDDKKLAQLGSVPNPVQQREERLNERKREKQKQKQKQQERQEREQARHKKKLEEKRKRLSGLREGKRDHGKREHPSACLDDDDNDDCAGNDSNVIDLDGGSEKRRRIDDGRRLTRSMSH